MLTKNEKQRNTSVFNLQSTRTSKYRKKYITSYNKEPHSQVSLLLRI